LGSFVKWGIAAMLILELDLAWAFAKPANANAQQVHYFHRSAPSCGKNSKLILQAALADRRARPISPRLAPAPRMMQPERHRIAQQTLVAPGESIFGRAGESTPDSEISNNKTFFFALLRKT
jgi:hypothetical protein